MPTVQAILERSLSSEPADPTAERTVVLDRGFQGLPDTAHGGSVLALLDAVAGRRGARHVRGHYLRRVPVAVPLRLATSHDDRDTRFSLRDASGAVLVDAAVASTDDGAVVAPAYGPGDAAAAVPISTTCFVCGIENPLGLQAQLEFDDDRVWTSWRPREAFRRSDRSVAPVALTALLDETAFWLGALATGESGMTTELRVTLHGDFAGDVVRIVGARNRATRRPDDARYWDTETVALDERDRVMATARITFVAVRGAARRLVTGLLAINSAETLRRVFPAYVAR